MSKEWEYQSRNFGEGKKSNLGVIFFSFFLFASIALFGIGAHQQTNDMNSLSNLFGSDLLSSSTSSSTDNSWKQLDFIDLPSNPDFQYKSDELATCKNSTQVGCGTYQVIAKYNCTSVDGTLAGNDEAGNVQETVTQSANEVTSGQPFPMEFDLNNPKSTNIRLTSLTCNR